jgi:mannose-6-phosphate isomerase-like protein (cupin superfamily)
MLRIEYRASRLVETARQRNRFLGSNVIAGVQLEGPNGPINAYARMNACPWINAYQVEFWETLEPPPGRRHDWQVRDLMGFGGSITREPAFDAVLKDLRSLRRLRLWFRESEFTEPTNYFVSGDASSWDNFYERNVQVPNTQDPSSSQNTVKESNYLIDFQRGWFFQSARSVAPVRYRNAMMNDAAAQAAGDANVIEMRWILQQEFGGSLVFFHEVTIPPRTVEGTHQHIGSEELYYITEGEGFAYMGANDNPDMGQYELVQRDIYGIGAKACRKMPVRPGSVIFTKSGGIHGIENPNANPLRFVAFLHHTS